MSKYDALGQWLKQIGRGEITLALDDIATIVGSLPPEANKHQFWANSPRHHQSRRRQWLDQGFLAFFDQDRREVRFVRSADGAPKADRSKRWNEGELRACAVAYHRLWLMHQQNLPFSKAAIRREVLQSWLTERSSGSYEYRMQNISSILNRLGIPYLPGYLPRDNLGAQRAPLIKIINEVWERSYEVEAPSDDPSDLETRVVAAWIKIKDGQVQTPPAGSGTPRQIAVATTRFLRDPNVIAWVLNRAGGKCESCNEPAPFERADSTGYLEVHHLKPLAEGGEDTVGNTVAVCPNCHRRFHFGKDRDHWRQRAIRQVFGS